MCRKADRLWDFDHDMNEPEISPLVFLNLDLLCSANHKADAGMAT